MNALEKAIASNKAFLTPAEVAPILGSDPQTIRIAARHQAQLGFPYTIVGTRVKIPRIPFLRFLGIEVDNREWKE